MSSEYWKDRFRQIEESQFKNDIVLAKEIEKLFTEAFSEINNKINRWYLKFAENNEITMQEAKKLLKKGELEEFKWTVEEYIKYGEKNLNEEYTKQLVNASDKVHINRYEALKVDLQDTIERLTAKEEKSLEEHLKECYQETYNHTAYEIQKGTGVGAYLDGVDERKMSNLLKKPWAVDGENFSDRIWKDKNGLENEIDKQLRTTFALGKSPNDAIDAISKRFNTSKSNAARLVYTESAAVSAKATEQCYKDLDVEEFEVLETLDSHTCPICGEMDGKHFPQSQYEIGLTVPPFHPRCRGTTVPYFDDMTDFETRAARDLEGNSFYVSGDTTYEEWKQMQDDKYGEGSVDKARKIEYNKSADLKQYEQYKKVLGADILGTEDEFRKKKYFDSKEFDKLKKLFKENSTYLQAQFPYIYNGEKLFIPDKTIIKSARTIAGAGSKTELRVEEKLVTQYGGNIGEWKKRVGKVESDKYIFDVHWYELNGKQYDMKLKHRSDKKI